jgi:mono/diheme cytochrome c family protein
MAIRKGKNMHRKSVLVTLFALSGFVAHAEAPPERAASRGELLYSTHCIACHDVEVHWRDKKIVTDPASLLTEVSRWQEAGKLGWGSEDIAEVARYLAATQYPHFKRD